MTLVRMHEAKSQLSRLVQRARAGEEVVIASGKTPLAVLKPYPEHPPKRVPGLLRGKIRVADDFDAPLPERILDDFEGGSR